MLNVKAGKLKLCPLSESGCGRSERSLSPDQGKRGLFQTQNMNQAFIASSAFQRLNLRDAIHTSTATVAVLAEVDDVDEIKIPPSEIEMDVYKAGGSGAVKACRKIPPRSGLTHKTYRDCGSVPG